MSKIYTKTGDQGETSLVGGTRIAKNDVLLQCYGTIDELNAAVGMAIAFMEETQLSDYQDVTDFLVNIQHDLFSVGGILATEPELWGKYWSAVDISLKIKQLEEKIDELSAFLPPLHDFILPNGSKRIAQWHLCRTICRRAEREIAEVYTKNCAYGDCLQFCNRLSDFFYILARFSHKVENISVTIWKSAH